MGEEGNGGVSWTMDNLPVFTLLKKMTLFP